MLEACKITGFADEIHRDLDVQLQVLAELNQKYIELRGADGINVADMTMENAADFKARMDAQGHILWQTRTPIHTAADRLVWETAQIAENGDILLMHDIREKTAE